MINTLSSFLENENILNKGLSESHILVEFSKLESKLSEIKLLFGDDIYFAGEFLRELDKDNDELIIILKYKKEFELVIFSKCKNNEILPKISNIFPAADNFEREIYDYFGKDTEGGEAYTLRLHTYKNNFFPWRKHGKAQVSEKKPFRFKTLPNKDVVVVPVGPTHAGIIPPGHFRFIVDGEDTLNLDIQLGFLHRGIERYFVEESDLEKLKIASEEIVGDSVISHSLTFIRAIEKLAGIKVSESTILNRIILLELERIYNHLWTVGALHNDVGQGFLLNTCLSIREGILDTNEIIYGSRLLKGVLDFGKNNVYIDENSKELLIKSLTKAKNRLENLLKISDSSVGIYDRLKDTGIVRYKTAFLAGSLGLSARASGIAMDFRQFDPYYKNYNVKMNLGAQGDAYDRTMLRAYEILDSIELISKILKNENLIGNNKEEKVKTHKLKPNTYEFSKTEGHRGEHLHIIHTNENGEIDYYKIKDPSFMNWTLLEYAVLNNIIADFPICNKSFDLSYSGFDL